MSLDVSTPTLDTLEQAVRERTLMLEHEVAERRNAEKLHRVLFQIAELALSANAGDKKFAKLHEIVGQLLSTPNFMITKFHRDTQEFSVKYYVDEYDENLMDERFPLGYGISSHVARTKQAQLVDRKRLKELIHDGHVKMLSGDTPPYSWLGAPLLVNDVLYGAIIVQSYSEKIVYKQSDLEVISFVANQVAAFFARIHADEEIYNTQIQLEQQNEKLNQTLQSLKTAQTELVEQEKLASLGRLVAGVAHEINTPLGICVTATSHMVEELNLLQKKFKNEDLNQEDLEEFFDIINSSLKIMTTNSQRGAALVKSFKQVAVDQSSESVREFNFKTYLDEILLSLHPKLKNKNFNVHVNCPEDVSVNTYPGAISQIVTNMVMNSVVHGFENKQQGCIFLEVKQENDTLCLKYADDGVGMSPESLEKLFEPFYTTKRGLGGSGLGAHIVYNLVTGPLGGTVKVCSEIDKGLQYQIRIPLQRVIKTSENKSSCL